MDNRQGDNPVTFIVPVGMSAAVAGLLIVIRWEFSYIRRHRQVKP